MSEFTPEELESAYRDAVGRPGLLPCPFCGSDDIVEVERKDTPGNSDKAGPIHGVYGCRSCLAIGPNTMEQWNTRPQGWISRKNLLPTEEGPVRVWIRAYGIMNACESVIWYSPSIKRFSFDNRNISHWQPLSEPPTTP